jgi:hypothetical protein
MANVQQASKVSLKERLESVLTLQEYRLNVLVQNFRGSTMFRHSLRLTIAIVFAYLLGFVFDIKHLLDFTDRHCHYAT